jgi:glycosyltransferase involved in cell wall biosynthesis
MTVDQPTVSAVIIFKDEERFLKEAINSVMSQTYRDWELLLVDDGSTDGSTAIAKLAAADSSGRVRYLDHDGHANLGMSASRNLGIANARGSYVASLDGDDVWLPAKLETQVAALDHHPTAAMTFGPLLRWRTWTGDPEAGHHEDLMGVGKRKFGAHPLAGTVANPPALLRLMLKDDYFIPGGALIRRDVLAAVGFYEERFRGMYEDAVLMVKIALEHEVLVGDEVNYLYRMHPASDTNRNSSDGQIDRARTAYLDWVEEYLEAEGASSRSLRFALWRAKRSTHARRQRRYRSLARGRALGRLLIPRSSRDALRRRWRQRTRPTVEIP